MNIIRLIPLMLILCLDATSSFSMTKNFKVITEKAIIHHTDSPCWTTAKHIDDWHKERGWDGIGYHYVIKCDGTIENGRSMNKSGAHAKGRNNYVGIAIVGNDNFSDAQYKSLNRLLEYLGTKQIERHHESCPGNGFDFTKIKTN